MLEYCEFRELNEDVLRECGGFLCKDRDITEFFTREYADYAYQLLGKSYCFVEQDKHRIVGAFTVANSSIRADLLPNSRRNRLNRNIPNEKRRPQYPAVLVGSLPSVTAIWDSISAMRYWMPSSHGSSNH